MEHWKLVHDSSKDVHEWTKRSVQHVANTEQRILFKEITLEPKSPNTDQMGSAGEGSSKEGAERDAQKIDRMTGRIAPATRAPRTKGSGKKKAKASAPESTQEGDIATDMVPNDRMDVTTDQ